MAADRVQNARFFGKDCRQNTVGADGIQPNRKRIGMLYLNLLLRCAAIVYESDPMHLKLYTQT